MKLSAIPGWLGPSVLLGIVLGLWAFAHTLPGKELWELEAEQQALMVSLPATRDSILRLTWTRDSGTVALNSFRDSNATRQAWKMRRR